MKRNKITDVVVSISQPISTNVVWAKPNGNVCTLYVFRNGRWNKVSSEIVNNAVKEYIDDSIPRVYANILATEDTYLKVDGKTVNLSAYKAAAFKNFSSIEEIHNPAAIARFNITATDISKLEKLKLFCNGYAPSITTLDVSNFDTSSVTDMSNWFRGCEALQSLDVMSWDTSNVTNMECMFYECAALPSLDVSSWDVSKVTNFNNMFSSCLALKSLDLSNWDLSSCETMKNIFSGDNITTLKLGEGFGKVTNSVEIMNFAPLTEWTDSSVSTLCNLYDRASNGLGTITIVLSAATKTALGETNIEKITAKGYIVQEAETNQVVTLDEMATEYTPTEIYKESTINLKRTFTQNSWNTFCVPFDIDNDQLKSQFGDDVVVDEFTSVDGTIICFTDVSEVKAGKPYLLKPTTETPVEGYYTFTGVTWLASSPESVSQSDENGTFTFYASFVKSTMPSGSYMFSKNKIYHITANKTFKGFRGYFVYTTDESSNSNLNFSLMDDETTGISEVKSEAAKRFDVYNTSGQKIKSGATSLKQLMKNLM